LSNYFDLLSAYCRARDIDIAILSVSPSVDGVCPLSPVHTSDKVDRIGNEVDFVADLSPVSATVDFVADVYQALDC